MIKKLRIWILVLLVITFMVGCTKEKSKETNKETKETQNTIDTPQNNELTICSLNVSDAMNSMIKSYKGEHPEVTINYRVLQEQGSEVLRNDAIKTLNTELLAGKGPDILILDNLPVDSYIKKGALMDMSDIFQNPSIKDNLLSNITGSFMTESGIYEMPTRFIFPYYGLREDAANQMSSMDDIAAYCKSKDRSFMAPTTYGRLISSFLRYYSDEVINEDASINKEGLKSFLMDINTIAQKTESYPGTIMEGYAPRTYEEGNLQQPDSLMWEDGTMVIRNFIKNLDNLEFLTAILQSMGGSYSPINNSYQPFCIVGITSTTKNPELAKDFVASLFDVKRQSRKAEEGGIPVNEKALLMWKRTSYTNGPKVYISREEKREKIEFDGLTAEEGCGYLEGKKTLDQAVDDIINRYNLFLDESR